jgi:hypothetical protein
LVSSFVDTLEREEIKIVFLIEPAAVEEFQRQPGSPGHKTFGSAGLRKFFYLFQIKHRCLKLNAIHFRSRLAAPTTPSRDRPLSPTGTSGSQTSSGDGCKPSLGIIKGQYISSRMAITP